MPAARLHSFEAVGALNTIDECVRLFTFHALAIPCSESVSEALCLQICLIAAEQESAGHVSSEYCCSFRFSQYASHPTLSLTWAHIARGSAVQATG